MPALRAEARRYARRGADVVTWTELAGRAEVLRHRPRWGIYAPTRQTDVGISWRRGALWRPVARRTYWLAPRTTIAVVVLERPGQRLLATVAHLPSHVEYGNHFRVGVPGKVEAWQQAVDRWRPTIRELRHRWCPCTVIVAADWNADVRRPAWRQRIASTFPGLRLTWTRPLPQRGTHRGGRIIDATLTNARGHARLLAHTDASDHRAYLERLRR